MAAAVSLFILVLFSFTTVVVSDPHYMVVVPAVIHYPNTEKLCIHLHSLPETVHLEITLETEDQNHTLVQKNVEQPGLFECIGFKVPAFVPSERKLNFWDEEIIAHIHVSIQKGDVVSFEGRKKVLVKNASPRILIQSDKPFYRSGETVRFRIVRFDGEFKAIDKIIPLIQLKDPLGNRIGQWLNMKPHHGILDLSFPLASEAALGKYNIQLGESLSIKMHTVGGEFTVEEYELKKFGVLFDLPPIVTTSDTEFDINVCGEYTFGKPVQGNVLLSLDRDVSYLFSQVANETLSRIQKQYTGKAKETGCATFHINGTDINLLQKGYNNHVELTAEMEEEGTGVKNTESAKLSIAYKVVAVSFSTLNPFYKQGFPYTGKISVSVREDPVQNQNVYLTVDVDDVETHITYVTDENGEAEFSLDTSSWKNTLVSLRCRYSLENVTQVEDVVIMMQSEDFIWLKPFYSESKSFLEIHHIEEDLPCEENQEVLVDYILDRKELDPEADSLDFYYLVISKGQIVSSGQKQVLVGKDETLKGTFSLPLFTDSNLAPTAWILLYAVFADGEVAADLDVFGIERCFKHKVTMEFSKEEEVPGSKVELKLEAAPGALCSVHAIDKRVLLKQDDTLTAEKIYEVFDTSASDIVSSRGFPYRLEDFEPYPCLPPHSHSKSHKRSLRVAPWYQSEADVYSLFKQLRMKILTNTEIKKPVSCDLPGVDRIPFRGTGQRGTEKNTVEGDVPQAIDSIETKTEEKIQTRAYFPEVSVWDLVPINEEGKAVHSVTVPDTITEWNADAFCLASNVGFGLSQPASLQIFKPFFVDLVLPFSVVRGEGFQLKATVFNYLDDCIQVKLNLLEPQEIEVAPCPDCQLISCLCADEVKTFSWNITATQLGHVKLSVTAEAEETQELCGNKVSVTPTSGRSDTVIKSLLVKPEGVTEEKNHNTFLCSSGNPVVKDISLDLPEAVVKDSGHATVSVVGDILGISLRHLDYLIQLPLGCGEQNMIKFAPNIFALQYLEKTNQITPEIKEQVIGFMKSGYQRQLFFRHDNGSYSAFGKRDAMGNIWLTAFVAKTFGQAKPYIYIDEKHISDAVRWLKQHQLPSGCFQSVGRVFNNALMGGIDDELSLTAYVTAAFLELHLEKNDPVVDDALLCLKRNSSSVTGVYTKVLLAYVFALAGDTKAQQQLLQELREHAIENRALTSLLRKFPPHLLPMQNVPEGNYLFLLDIESTAYFLLAYLSGPTVSSDDISFASQIAASLVLLQNTFGGFFSTQDSVVGLQALTKYAGVTYRDIEELKVLIKSSNGFQHEFQVDKKNRLVLQQVSLPEVPGQYKVEVSGNGCVYVQTTLRYNKPAPKSDAFALNVSTSSNNCDQTSRKQFDVQIQVSYTGERMISNMVLLEVNLLSGFSPVKTTLKKLQLIPVVKKVEAETDKINIYLDEMDKNVQIYSISVQQEIEVLNLKEALVRVYDYYLPEDSAVAEYNTPCSKESTKKDHQ